MAKKNSTSVPKELKTQINFLFGIAVLAVLILSSCNTPTQQSNQWTITHKNGGESKITPVEITDKKMVFRDKVGPEKNATQVIRLMRAATGTKYYVGQHSIVQDDIRDQVLTIELEEVEDGCFVGEARPHKSSNRNARVSELFFSRPDANCFN